MPLSVNDSNNLNNDSNIIIIRINFLINFFTPNFSTRYQIFNVIKLLRITNKLKNNKSNFNKHNIDNDNNPTSISRINPIIEINSSF